MWTIAVAVSIIDTSIQLITVPLKLVVRGLIINFDTNGKWPLAEILKKVNKVELIITGASLFSEWASIARSEFTKIDAGVKVHSSKLLSGLLKEHISSSMSPAQTSEFPGGDIVTATSFELIASIIHLHRHYLFILP